MLGPNKISIDGRDIALVDIAPDHYRIYWKRGVSDGETFKAFKDLYESLRLGHDEYVRMHYASNRFLFIEFITRPTTLSLDEFFKGELPVATGVNDVYINTPHFDLTFVPNSARSEQARFDISIISMVYSSHVLPYFIQRTHGEVPESYISPIMRKLEELLGDIGRFSGF